MKLQWEYPGFCAKCGKGWGDHLSDLALESRPRACKFEAVQGEIDTPRKVGQCEQCKRAGLVFDFNGNPDKDRNIMADVNGVLLCGQCA